MIDDLRTPLILYPKKTSGLWLFVVSSLFVLIGIGLGNEQGWVGYACAAFFTLGAVAGIVKMIPGGAYLKLDETGFTYCNLFQEWTTPWSVVDRFYVVTQHHASMPVNRFVGFDYVPGYEHQRIGRQIATAVADCEGGLPDTYGMPAEELAQLMNSRLRSAREAQS